MDSVDVNTIDISRNGNELEASKREETHGHGRKYNYYLIILAVLCLVIAVTVGIILSISGEEEEDEFSTRPASSSQVPQPTSPPNSSDFLGSLLIEDTEDPAEDPDFKSLFIALTSTTLSIEFDLYRPTNDGWNFTLHVENNSVEEVIIRMDAEGYEVVRSNSKSTRNRRSLEDSILYSDNYEEQTNSSVSMNVPSSIFVSIETSRFYLDAATSSDRIPDTGSIAMVSFEDNNPQTGQPTTFPTKVPSLSPTKGLSGNQSSSPSTTFAPTQGPSERQSSAPSTTLGPSFAPTAAQSRVPTQIPSESPSSTPSTSNPTLAPTTAQPTQRPSESPTSAPSTSYPSFAPTTAQPSKAPTTAQPSKAPTTSQPSKSPTKVPTGTPSRSPTKVPTTQNPTVAGIQPPTIPGSLCFFGSDTCGDIPAIGGTDWKEMDCTASPISLICNFKACNNIFNSASAVTEVYFNNGKYVVQIFSSFVAWFERENGVFINAILGSPKLSSNGKRYQFEISVPRSIIEVGQEVYVISKSLSTSQVLDRLPDSSQPALGFTECI
jgi:hypothetical protein